MEKLNIKHLKFNNNAWLRTLEFYDLEFQFLQERLQEISADNTSHETRVKIGYFENELLIHREQGDILKHRIHELETTIEKQLNSGSTFLDKETIGAAAKLADDFATEEKMIAEFRQAFNRFAAEWM